MGKTSLARLIAKHIGCKKANVNEIDAASHSGVDNARHLVAGMTYSNLGKNKVSVTIIDECHALSKAAWQVLLKAVEEPAKDHYWVFCTTEATKVPRTIVTRCLSYQLKEVDDDTMLDYLTHVAEAEGSTSLGDTLELITEEAQGSPRQALSMLALVLGTDLELEGARDLFASAHKSRGVLDLCRELHRPKPNWKVLSGILTDLKGTAPEGIRRQVLYYATSALLKSRTLDGTERSLCVVESFSEELPEGETTIAPIVLAVTRTII